MTLHFLGDVDEELLDELIASVRGLDPTQLLGEGPLDADWAGFSAFPNPRRARVIVARSTDPEGRLGALAAHFGEVARRFDLPIEERAYRPHVTVARVQALNVAGLCEAVPLTGPIRFSAVHLYESELTPEGSRYRSLAHAVTT